MKLKLNVGNVSTLRRGFGFECDVWEYFDFLNKNNKKLFATAYGNTKEKAIENANLISSVFDMLHAINSFIDLYNDSDMRPEDECHELAHNFKKILNELKDRINKPAQ